MTEDSDVIGQARRWATLAHEEHVDKSGQPYIAHPARVAAAVWECCHPSMASHAVAAAWLHDVVEDTPITLTDLQRACFPLEVIAAVDALTHRPNEPKQDYMARVCTNRIARLVKRCDVLDNLSEERLSQLDELTQARLRQKYAQALEWLGAA